MSQTSLILQWTIGTDLATIIFRLTPWGVCSIILAVVKALIKQIMIHVTLMIQLHYKLYFKNSVLCMTEYSCDNNSIQYYHNTVCTSCIIIHSNNVCYLTKFTLTIRFPTFNNIGNWSNRSLLILLPVYTKNSDLIIMSTTNVVVKVIYMYILFELWNNSRWRQCSLYFWFTQSYTSFINCLYKCPYLIKEIVWIFFSKHNINLAPRLLRWPRKRAWIQLFVYAQDNIWSLKCVLVCSIYIISNSRAAPCLEQDQALYRNRDC